MFVIHLSKIMRLNGATLTASARTLDGALDFIGEFYDGPLFLSWVKLDGTCVVEVYDWLDCWFDDPPIRARVMTPSGFRPPDCQTWFRNRSA
jgi:hypothetical protein